MSEQEPGGEVFVTNVALRWSDMDSLGHVNNAAAVTLLEEGRIQFLNALVGDFGAEFSGGLVAARHEIDYLRPMFYSAEPITIRQWITRIGTSSFTFGAEIAVPDGGIAVRASTVVVVVDSSGAKSAPVPPRARELLSRFAVRSPAPR